MRSIRYIIRESGTREQQYIKTPENEYYKTFQKLMNRETGNNHQ
jgi:hypothetical protein